MLQTEFHNFKPVLDCAVNEVNISTHIEMINLQRDVAFCGVMLFDNTMKIQRMFSLVMMAGTG